MPEAGFPRMSFSGNSPFCIKKGVLEGYGYLSSLPTPTLKVVLPSDPTRSVLLALGLAIARNTDRILMQNRCISLARVNKVALSLHLLHTMPRYRARRKEF